MAKKILVVDDEVELIKALQIRLKAAGFEVIVACDGQEGLDKAQKEKPDLILLDIQLPKMDGYQTLVKLKSLQETKSIPVIMLTAKSQVGDVEKAISKGASDYMVKPYSHLTLIEKIRRTLQ